MLNQKLGGWEKRNRYLMSPLGDSDIYFSRIWPGQVIFNWKLLHCKAAVANISSVLHQTVLSLNFSSVSSCVSLDKLLILNFFVLQLLHLQSETIKISFCIGLLWRLNESKQVIACSKLAFLSSIIHICCFVISLVILWLFCSLFVRKLDWGFLWLVFC